MRRLTLADIGTLAVAVVELRARARASPCEATFDGEAWCNAAGREPCAACQERFRLLGELRRAANTLSAAISRWRKRNG